MNEMTEKSGLFIGCLQDIVGITQKEYVCFPDFPTEANLSKSGFYLDEIPEFVRIFDIFNQKGFINSSSQEMYKLFKNCIDLAINSVNSSISGLLMQKEVTGYELDKRLKTAKHERAGSAISAGYFEPSKNYAVLRIKTQPIRRGVLVIKGIGLGVFASRIGNVNVPVPHQKQVMIFDNLGNYITDSQQQIHPKATIDFDTTNTGNSWELFGKQADGSFVEPIRVPMSLDGQPNYIYIAYETDEKWINNNHSWCGCSLESQKPTWLNGVSFDGLETDTLNGISDFIGMKSLNACQFNNKGISTMNNIKVDFSLECDTASILCDNIRQEDMTDPIYNHVAQAIRSLAAVELAKTLIHLDLALIDWRSISGITTQVMQGVIGHHKKKAFEFIAALSESVNVTSSGCYVCDSSVKRSVGFVKR